MMYEGHRTPLHTAEAADLAEVLIRNRNGADVNATDDSDVERLMKQKQKRGC